MIDKFDGQYAFLSNFHLTPLVYRNMRFTSSEAAFQSQKTTDPEEMQSFCDLAPGASKRKGREVKLRDNWDIIKDQIMYEVCYAKFSQNPNLMMQLLDTGDEELVEGNTWNDTYWGVCNGVGENRLGKTLMILRKRFRDEMHAMKDDLVDWTREWFDQNGKDCKAVIGLSGGKDSTVAAAICVEALGKDRVVGVTIPNIIQTDNTILNEDLKDVKQLVDHLGIQLITVPIGAAYNDIIAQLTLEGGIEVSEQTKTNLSPRLRMSVLYAVSQSINGRVINTSNRSEQFVGYSTRWGDNTGDCALFLDILSDEVVMIGDACGLPVNLTHKVPSDGLCGKTDEDNLGFTYAELNSLICTGGMCLDEDKKKIIMDKHVKNVFKTKPIPFYPIKLDRKRDRLV